MKASAGAEDPVAGASGAPPASGGSGVVELLDGTRITYRLIRPEDVGALQRFHRRLSEHSIYLRFFGAMPKLSDRRTGYFTNVDGINRFALVALDPERPEEIIGIASFYREGSTDRAEYAAAAEDRW